MINTGHAVSDDLALPAMIDTDRDAGNTQLACRLRHLGLQRIHARRLAHGRTESCVAMLVPRLGEKR